MAFRKEMRYVNGYRCCQYTSSMNKDIKKSRVLEFHVNNNITDTLSQGLYTPYE